MKFDSLVVHAGDRKRRGGCIPSTTPIHLGTTYFYDSAVTLDRVFAHEEEGFSYGRYANPTSEALEELTTAMENGHGSLACASGMAALQIALQAALVDRAPRIVAAQSLYGATIKLFDQVFGPLGVETSYVDICDLKAVEQAIFGKKPGCVFMETVSNPLLRVAAVDEVAKLTKAAGIPLVVDNTFATPMMIRPLEYGANIVVHSATKYLAGHGDVLGGIVVSDAEYHEVVRTISRIAGPVMGPFESYLTMRGIKTLALRFARQCDNACKLASWLTSHPAVDRVFYLADPRHPDAATVKRLFGSALFGAIVSFEIKGAHKEAVMAFMDRLKMVVPGTSLGDVHTLLLYPVMSSHRDVSPKIRERMGIRENLVRVSLGIEAAEDVIADLDQALTAT
ncbi:MAG: PLP-dependent aspartate aminotransferase family protein [Bryobacteraceae bacterium]